MNIHQSFDERMQEEKDDAVELLTNQIVLINRMIDETASNMEVIICLRSTATHMQEQIEHLDKIFK